MPRRSGNSNTGEESMRLKIQRQAQHRKRGSARKGKQRWQLGRSKPARNA